VGKLFGGGEDGQSSAPPMSLKNAQKREGQTVIKCVVVIVRAADIAARRLGQSVREGHVRRT